MKSRRRDERSRIADPARPPAGAIGWERARGIFDDPRPPATVWERQFDHGDDALRRLARTPYDRVDFGDLWYYYHDLAYVELQPDLLDYLFPVCLMDWHTTLANNEACAHGDAEFHRGLLRGKILETMVTPERRAAIFEFFRDSFLARLDAERGFVYAGSKTPAYGWMARFNSLGVVAPRIDLFWGPWWSLDTAGRAVAALQYLSGLMYFEGENPLFGRWTQDQGGGGPYMWENDSNIHEAGWTPENVEFLAGVLTAEFVEDRVAAAADRLGGEPEAEKARLLVDDLARCRELVELRVAELPRLLGLPPDFHEWSV